MPHEKLEGVGSLCIIRKRVKKIKFTFSIYLFTMGHQLTMLHFGTDLSINFIS